MRWSQSRGHSGSHRTRNAGADVGAAACTPDEVVRSYHFELCARGARRLQNRCCTREVGSIGRQLCSSSLPKRGLTRLAAGYDPLLTPDMLTHSAWALGRRSAKRPATRARMSGQNRQGRDGAELEFPVGKRLAVPLTLRGADFITDPRSLGHHSLAIRSPVATLGVVCRMKSALSHAATGGLP